MIKVIVSGSRFSKERNIIIDMLNDLLQATVFCYDCEKDHTAITDGGKQSEIDERVKECDWFILVANTVTCGKYTAQEWDAILSTIKDNRADKVVTVFRCTNPEESSKAQGIKEDGAFKFEEMLKKPEAKGLGEQFYVDYAYDDEQFAKLKNEVRGQIDSVAKSNLLMKTVSRPMSEISAIDVYTNSYRVDPEYGFDENFYLKRQSVDGELAIKCRSHKLIIITGSPASGKTRALYEYLKTLRSNPASRYIVVTESNLEDIAATLKSFHEWIRKTPSARSMDLSDYYFIIDQIGDILYNERNLEHFEDFHNIVLRYDGHIFATSLIEPFENLRRDHILPDETERIQIKKLDETTDSEFNEELKQHYGNDEDWGNGTKQVIGDYIKGLRKYKDSISGLVKKSGQKKDIVGFIKAFNIINLFRKGNVWPLGLVVSVAEKICGKTYTQEELEALLGFFRDNNILHEYSVHRRRSTWQINRDEKYDYDGESLSMLIPPYILIKIDNDYIWQYLRTERYPLDYSHEGEMTGYMNRYCDAFFNDVPLPTLRRIITRSPALVFALKYNAGTNFVREFVIDRIYQLYDSRTEYSKEEMGEMIAYILHRSSNLEELKEDYDCFVEDMGEVFVLNEKIVAELMGFAQYKTSEMKMQLKAFLTEKGWDFSRKCISFYYHKRMVQYLDSFPEVETYIKDNVLLDSVLNGQDDSQPELLEVNKQSFICALVSKCRCVNDLRMVFEWNTRINARFDKFFFKALADAVKEADSIPLRYSENLAMMECVCDNLTPQNAMMPEELICYHTLRMSSSFMNSLSIYHRYENTCLKENPAVNARCMSVMMESVNKNEFAYVYRFLFKDGRLQYPLHQISRNLLLENLDFNSAMVLYDLLFDSSDENSTPDIYTLCSLLKVNIQNIKVASYKRINDPKFNESTEGISKIESLIYQNLLQILQHPYTKNINELEMVLPQIVLCCLTKSQEDYVVRHYIKPSFRRLDRMRTSGQLSEAQYTEREEAFWENKLKTDEIAMARIQRRVWTNMDEVHAYVISILDDMFGAAKPVPSATLNCYMNKIFSFNHLEHPECKKSKEDLTAYREVLDKYLSQKFKLANSETYVTKLDRVIKDEYFYPPYYRLFPEKIVVKEGDRYVIDRDVFFSIPKDFINEKLYSHILEGVAYFMDREALDDVLSWLNSEVQDFSIYYASRRFIRKAYPEYELNTVRKDVSDENDIRNEADDKTEPLWKCLKDFLHIYSQETDDPSASVTEFANVLEKVKDIKKNHPDAIPNYALLHKLIKPFKNNSAPKRTLMNSRQVLDLMETLFLEHGLPVTPTLWKSVLECILHNVKHLFDKGKRAAIEIQIDSLYQKYPHLIIDDQTTNAYKLTVYSKEGQKKILENILSSDRFLTSLDLSQLIIHNILFASKEKMTEYIRLMKMYHELHLSMIDEAKHSETYGHFLTGCAYNYKFVSDRGQKEFIYQMSTFIEHSRKLSQKLVRIEYVYDPMVNDLEKTLAKDVTHLKKLKS